MNVLQGLIKLQMWPITALLLVSFYWADQVLTDYTPDWEDGMYLGNWLAIIGKYFKGVFSDAWFEDVWVWIKKKKNRYRILRIQLF